MRSKFRSLFVAWLMLISLAISAIPQGAINAKTTVKPPEKVRIKVDKKGKMYGPDGKQIPWQMFAFSSYLDGQDLKKGTARKRPTEMDIDKAILEKNDFSDKNSAQYKRLREYMSAEYKLRRVIARRKVHTKKRERVGSKKRQFRIKYVDHSAELTAARLKIDELEKQNNKLLESKAYQDQHPVINTYSLSIEPILKKTMAVDSTETYKGILTGKTAEGVAFVTEVMPTLIVETDVKDGYVVNSNELTIKAPGKYTVRGVFTTPIGAKEISSTPINFAVATPWSISELWSSIKVPVFYLLLILLFLLFIRLGVQVYRAVKKNDDDIPSIVEVHRAKDNNVYQNEAFDAEDLGKKEVAIVEEESEVIDPIPDEINPKTVMVGKKITIKPIQQS